MSEINFKNYANSFQAIARLELESISLLVEYLGHPERELKFIHIAGTNGKGSVAAFLQEIFTAAGYRTGKYISPNMISVTERVSVDGVEILPSELDLLLSKVEEASKKVTEKLGEPPTQFEIWTAAAFCWFKEKKCDMVILETGLGGCRDATNVIPTPEAAVITRVAMDHMSYLGNTLAEIATQKAGIIKRGTTLITGRQEKEVTEVLKADCNNKGCGFIQTTESQIGVPNGIFEVFCYRDMQDVEVGIAGLHQVENACIAIETAKYFGIAEDKIRIGLKKARNIGRFDLIRENIIFDGAHNPNGMAALMCGLKRYFPKKQPAFVMGMMEDKDIAETADVIKKAYPEAKLYTVSVKDNPRSDSAEGLAKKLNSCGLTAVAMEDIATAVDMAKTAGEPVVICGSLYLYKDFFEA